MRGFNELQAEWRRIWDAFATDAFTLLIALPLLAVVCGLIYIGAGSVFGPSGLNQATEQVAWRPGVRAH
jgi:hypothetical protein